MLFHRKTTVCPKYFGQDCRNQYTDLLCKSMDLFLYDNGLRHKRVKKISYITAIGDKKIKKCSIYICGVVLRLSMWFKLNTFLSLVLFSAGIHKGKGKNLTRKTIKCKLDGSSKT